MPELAAGPWSLSVEVKMSMLDSENRRLFWNRADQI
jgi:hypothetical protein